jgi:hypothetical protein
MGTGRKGAGTGACQGDILDTKCEERVGHTRGKRVVRLELLQYR